MEDLSDNALEKIKKELLSIPSVGELTVRSLIRAGYDSIDKLRNTTVEDLYSLDNIGEIQAQRIKQEIEERLGVDKDTKEVNCPNCGVYVLISNNSCSECGTNLIISDHEVVLPDGTIVDDPLSTLADIDAKFMDGEEDEDLWYSKGAILEAMGALEKAYEAYDKVIEFDPLYDWIWNAKASLAMKLGRLDEASRAYKVAVDYRIDEMYLKRLQERKTEPETEVAEKTPVEINMDDVIMVEEKITNARRTLHRIDTGLLDLTGIEDLLNFAAKARNRDNREEALKYAEKVITVGKNVEENLPMIEELELKIAGMEFEHEGIATLVEMYENLKVKTEDPIFMEDIKKVNELFEKVNEILEELDVCTFYMENFNEVKKILSESRGTKISLEPVKELVRKALESGKKGEFQKGLGIAKDIKVHLVKINEIHQKILDAKKLIVRLKDLDGQVDEIINAVKNSKDIADSGDYDEANHRLNDILHELGDEINHVKEEPVKEEVEIEKDYEQNIDKETILKKISEMKSLIIFARSENLMVDSSGESINKAIKSTAAGELDDAMKQLEQGYSLLIERLEEKLKERMDSVKETLEYTEKGKMTDNAKEHLELAEVEFKKGNLVNAFKMVTNAELLGEEAKGDAARAKDYITSLEHMIELANEFGLDHGEASGLLEKAKKIFENQRWEKALELANKAKDAAMMSMKGKLNSIMDDAQRELKEAKISGVNISIPIQYIKEVRKAELEGDLGTALKYMNMYRKYMSSQGD